MQNKKVLAEIAQPLVITGAPGKDRTCGTWIRNPMLYPLSYGGQDCLLKIHQLVCCDNLFFILNNIALAFYLYSAFAVCTHIKEIIVIKIERR